MGRHGYKKWRPVLWPVGDHYSPASLAGRLLVGNPWSSASQQLAVRGRSASARLLVSGWRATRGQAPELVGDQPATDCNLTNYGLLPFFCIFFFCSFSFNFFLKALT
jgi:hypothetical protein